MLDRNEPRFDMKAKPQRQKWYLKLLAWLLAFPNTFSHRLKVNRRNMKGLKPPYILLCTHHAFIDFSVTTHAIFPHSANYVVAIDGFIGRENLLRSVGCLCKRKFTNDIVLVRQIEHSLKVNKTIIAIYPEARYSLVGTNAILPDSLAKLCKMMKHPIVVLNMHGDYLSQPVWNLHKRKVRLAADMTQIVTQEEVGVLSSQEINKRIQEAFVYDEYKYQLETNQRITYADRAKGLHRVLYQCPACLTEHEMDSDGDRLWCNHCHKIYVMDELGRLQATEGVTEFPHIPDWYEFERVQVRKQLEEGTYRFEDEVIVDSLPNAKGYIRLGKAKLTHDSNGFVLEGMIEGEVFRLVKEPLSMYSAHIEYQYLGGDDCIDLSTLDDTYYLYPQTKKNVVTKLHFAVEELYKIKSAK
jgi:DNA-directed RNA polymerase subunit RPC12/RpoP